MPDDARLAHLVEGFPELAGTGIAEFSPAVGMGRIFELASLRSYASNAGIVTWAFRA